MKVVQFLRTACGLCCFMFSSLAMAVTEPAVVHVPYTWAFSTCEPAETNYPAGVIGWRVGNTASDHFLLTPAVSDHPLLAPSSASETTGGLHNYNGKLGLLDAGSGAYTLACAINTSGKTNVTITYDIMTLRNPFDGVTNTRTNACTLQYRLGTTGNFSLTGMTYTNDETQQKTGTTPQNPCTQTFTLPIACDNQPVVQLRWVARDISGKGYRPSFALGRIHVTGDEVCPGLLAPQGIRVTGITATSFSLAWEAVSAATAYVLDVYACPAPRGESFFQESFDGFSGSSNLNRENTLDTYMQTPGWTGSAVYEAVGSIRLGNSTTRGWLQTPQLNSPGTFTMTFDARAWDSIDEATAIDVYRVQATLTNVLETIQLSKTQMQSYVIQAEAVTGGVLGFTAKRNTGNRFYLDNLKLTAGVQPPPTVTNSLTVATHTALIQGLKSGVRYGGVIRSIQGTEQSINSAEFTVKTSNGTLIFLH